MLRVTGIELTQKLNAVHEFWHARWYMMVAIKPDGAVCNGLGSANWVRGLDRRLNNKKKSRTFECQACWHWYCMVQDVLAIACIQIWMDVGKVWARGKHTRTTMVMQRIPRPRKPTWRIIKLLSLVTARRIRIRLTRIIPREASIWFLMQFTAARGSTDFRSHPIMVKCAHHQRKVQTGWRLRQKPNLHNHA